MCNAYAGGGVESAARIIFKVAQACGINPQALIVMLQKEQGLVTDTYPYDSQYRIAMGQGCPDTAACDSRYFGFFNQVHGAAWQLKRYANPPGTSNYFTWYAPGKTWNVRWHPNAACGSSPVYIQNKATAALYYYTPYQPNAAALRAGYGTGDGCSSYGNRNFYQYFTDWFGSTQFVAADPVGEVTTWTPTARGVRVEGWALDPDTEGAVIVRVKAGAQLAARITTDRRSDDAAARHPGWGSVHGFEVDVALPAGEHDICVAVNNVGPGAHRTIACRTVAVPGGGDPVGAVTLWRATATGAQVSGWAVDPDTAGAVTVRVKSGEELVARVRADQPGDGAREGHGAFGDARAFSADVALGPGTHTVCIAVNNEGGGTTRTIGCRDITTVGGSPVGVVESWSQTPTGVTVSGWVLDPDTAASVAVRVKDDEELVARAVADRESAAAAAAYPAYGRQRGFVVEVPLSPGTHQVCIAANNVGAGGNRTLGCQTVRQLSGSPVGVVESWSQTPTGVTVSGWVFDPDTAASVAVRVKDDEELVARAVADRESAAAAAAYPAYGRQRGFVVEVPLSPGTHQVCIAANNVGAGGNRTLGCTSIAVAQGGDPFGYINSWTPVPGGVEVKGWAIDPDTAGPVQIRVKSNETLIARFSAAEVRRDVGARYPMYGAEHGFQVTVPLPPGAQSVCAVANNVGRGSHRTLGCVSLTVSG